jgi:hypothetical protein
VWVELNAGCDSDYHFDDDEINTHAQRTYLYYAL